jgi:hypothetical protein
MPSRRKSPRKSSGVGPDYYRTEDAQDSPNLPSRKAVKPTPSKYKHKIGYKEKITKSPPERKKSTNKSPSESSYEEESESEEEDVIDDPRKKKSTNMISNTSNRKLSATKVSERARREERTNDDDEDEDDVENEKNSPEVEVSNIRRRIWERENDRNDIDDIDDDSAHGVSRHNENKRKRDDDDYYELGGSQINEMTKKDGEITKLKRTIKTLESKIKDMQRTSMGTPSRDKTGWKGEEFVFVKEVNDFCRDRLYPKEKFLRKNWKEYLPDDTRSLYSVSMKHLSIPEGSDKRDIWERVIVPSIRDKYQSMRCNMNNKIKSVYLSMRNVLVYANTYPTY